MYGVNLKSVWSQVLGWGAVLLGLGALVGGGAKAEAAQFRSPDSTSSPSQSKGSAAEQVMVRLSDGRVQLSFDGTSFEDLRLGNTPEAAHLKRLLRKAGGVGQPISVPIGSMIVASGGGAGNGSRPSDSGKGK